MVEIEEAKARAREAGGAITGVMRQNLVFK